jgi:hypothetical protein
VKLFAPEGTSESLDLRTFADYLEHDLAVCDVDSLAAAAPAFERLLNDPRLISAFVETELQAWRMGSDAHPYASQSLVLLKRPHFFIRANLWTVPDAARPVDRTDPRFIHLIPHDHNFAFLTGGYRGPGYTTELYEYDAAALEGVANERVTLVPKGRYAFPRGTMMLYEPSRDVHAQDHPAATSISINVMVPGPYSRRPQYLFDVAGGRLERVIPPRHTTARAVCAIASALGDDATTELLADVARRAPDGVVRQIAADALNRAVVLR